MIFLYILLALLLLIAFILLLSLRISIKYGEQTYIGVGILGVYYKLAPQKKKASKKTQKKTAKTEKQKRSTDKKNNILSEFTDNLEISDFIDLLRKLITRLVESSTGHLKVRIKKLEVTVADEMPDKAAILYGAVTTGTSLLLEYLKDNTKLYPLEKSSVFVTCDFNSKNTKAVLELVTKIRIIHLAKFAIMFFLDFIKMKETKNNKSTLKGTK